MNLSKLITADQRVASGLAAAKAGAITKVLAWTTVASLPFTAGVSSEEMTSWPVKGPAAEAFLNGTATQTQTAMLQAEASLTGETVESLAQTVFFKWQAYAVPTGVIAGLRRKVEAAIATATTVDSVNTITDQAIAEAAAMLQQLAKQAADAATAYRNRA